MCMQRDRQENECARLIFLIFICKPVMNAPSFDNDALFYKYRAFAGCLVLIQDREPQNSPFLN